MTMEEKKIENEASQDTENTAEPAPEETAAAEDVKEETTAEKNEGGKDPKNEKKKVRKLEAKISELEKQLADAAAASADKDSKYLLLAAEYDNFRRRTAKEKEQTYTEAYSDCINSLLPVLDNLYRAVGSQDEKGLSDGLKMTVKSYEDALSKLGVEEIKALGETFNPELHCAVFHVEDEAYGENEIVEVLAKGYKRGDKVIRYAIVKVAN